MKSERCLAIQSSFSAYLDGDVSGHEMQQIARHLEGFEETLGGDKVPPCDDCAREFAAWRSMQQSLALIGPAKPPADLSLKLRLAISREHARRDRSWLDHVSLAWDNILRPAMFRVGTGVAATAILVGSTLILLGVFSATPPVEANDEPLGAITAPHYLYSTVEPGAILTDRDTAIVVQASVDNQGRVYDYTILSGPQDDAVRTQVVNQLLLSVFQPASVFGLPVRGQVLLTYAGISVHG